MSNVWTLRPGGGLETLQLREEKDRRLAPGEVRVSIMANSINSRDVMAAMGHSPMSLPDEIVPVSDGAGVILETGEQVT